LLLLALIPAVPVPAAPPGPAAPAAGIRLIASDERGVTLGLDLPAFGLEPGPDARSEVTGTGLPLLDEPGRPRLPYAYALLAVPPGARASAAVEPGPEETREGVKLAVGDRPGFRDDAGRLGIIPTREPAPAIADGPWPRAAVELSEPFEARHQRLIAIQIRPFRYDEAAGRLWARRSVTVRVSFSGGAPARGGPARTEDRHWEPVLRRALINYEQGRSWRTPSGRLPAIPEGGSLFEGPLTPGLRSTAFDESEPEVRVQLDSSGVYGIEYSKLEDEGFPSGVPIGEVSVHRHEFTGNDSPPYATVELPIEVEEGVNRNGVLDAGDRIIVWVPSWAARTRASVAQRAWGDGDVVYVTRLRGGAGARIGLRSGWRNSTPPVLTSYPWTQRWERNFSYMNFPPDTNTDPFHWTEVAEYYSRPDSFGFEFNHLDPARNVNFSVTLQGRKAEAHWTWCQVENGSGQFTTVADSIQWSGKEPETLRATLPASAFSEGRTNRMRLWGKTNAGPPDPFSNAIARFALNWFDATYWRRYRALGGILACNSGDAVGEYEIQADGFANDSIRAYDVSDSLNPTRLTDVVIEQPTTEYRLKLQDLTAGTPRAYVIFGLPKLLPASRYTAVTRRQLYAQGPADYLLVVPEAFLGAANRLAALRRSEGLTVLIAPLESVDDEFNGGRHSSYAIRRFIRYAYDRWDTRFVLLMGDGSEDPQNLLSRAGPDWIPVQKILGPVLAYTGEGVFPETVAGDPWYVWAVDTPPAPGRPYLPDLYLGRLPVNSLQQATDVVDKLVTYARVDTTQTWRRRILLHADDAWSSSNTFGGQPTASAYCLHPDERVFATLSQSVRSVIADSASLVLSEIELFDVNVLLKDELVDGNNCRPDQFATQLHARTLVTEPLLDRLNDGRLWWNYQGHANAQVLEHEYVWRNYLYEYDQDRLTNDDKPFFFTAFSCHANQFAQFHEADPTVGPCIGENLLRMPRRGAIAAWASPGYEIIPASGTDHLNVTLAKSLFLRPPRDDYLGQGASAVLGEGIALTLLLNYAAKFNSPYERDVGVTYTLLGDPATRLTIGAPQLVVTANGVPVSDGVPVFLPGQSDTLELEADLVSNAAIDSISLERTDASGTILLPGSDYTLTPPFPDTDPGGGGGRHFHLSYRTRLTAGNLRFTLGSRDRYGVTSAFNVVFAFQTGLYAEGRPIHDEDPVARDARLTLLVLSPGTLNPATDMTLTVDGANQPFTYTPANNDLSGRQWWLSWTHDPYASGSHVVKLGATGSPTATHSFAVVSRVRITHLLSFPNPFDDELGTRFSFTLTGEEPADLLLRVFSVTGRMIYERTERGLSPGYHELAWDGRDADGDKLGNGVYLYRVVAAGPSGHASEQGRLVKLRRPRQSSESEQP